MGMDKRGSFCLKDCGQAQVAYNTRAGVENWEGEVSAGGTKPETTVAGTFSPSLLHRKTFTFFATCLWRFYYSLRMVTNAVTNLH